MKNGFEYYESLIERGMIKEEDRPPDITPFSYLINSYFELSTSCNQNGIIPWNMIHEFAKINDIENVELFSHCIRVLEKAFKEDSDGKITE